MSTVRRGAELQRLARACLEARAYRVELVRRAVRWIIHQADGKLKPLSVATDLFGIWDAVYVGGVNERGFAQVTTEANFHARRAKILAAHFPVTPADLIMAHRRGTRTFRVARGPLFLLPGAEEWEAPRPARAQSAEGTKSKERPARAIMPERAKGVERPEPAHVV